MRIHFPFFDYAWLKFWVMMLVAKQMTGIFYFLWQFTFK